MDPEDVLRELEALAGRLGVLVRFEPFDLDLGKGGLCRLRGRPLVVIDARLPLLDRIAVLSQALACFDLEAVYLPPLLRARLAEKGARGA